eukprot:scaffold2086_cov149-Skeletonema_menzelii.AAC.13
MSAEPAGRYPIAAIQQHSPARIAAALKQAPPLTTAAMTDDYSPDEIAQQLQHRGSRCYINWPSTVEAGAI